LYLFAELDKKREQVKARGVDVISLSIGDPDIPTPKKIVETLQREAGNPANHQYPSYEGMFEYREAVANWYKRRFDVTLDPKDEVLSLIGSKEGIAHIYLAFVQPGDISLVPSPGYPVYNVGTIIADGTPYTMPLLKKNGFTSVVVVENGAEALEHRVPVDRASLARIQPLLGRVGDLEHLYHVVAATNAELLQRKLERHGAGAAKASRDLVGDEENVVFAAQGSGFAQEAGGRQEHSRCALN